MAIDSIYRSHVFWQFLAVASSKSGEWSMASPAAFVGILGMMLVGYPLLEWLYSQIFWISCGIGSPPNTWRPPVRSAATRWNQAGQISAPHHHFLKSSIMPMFWLPKTGRLPDCIDVYHVYIHFCAHIITVCITVYILLLYYMSN